MLCQTLRAVPCSTPFPLENRAAVGAVGCQKLPLGNVGALHLATNLSIYFGVHLVWIHVIYELILGAGSIGNQLGRNGNQFSGLVSRTSRDCSKNRSQNVTETGPEIPVPNLAEWGTENRSLSRTTFLQLACTSVYSSSA